MLDTDTDDAVLVARVRGGDADAFEVLARRHHGWLVATCLRHLGGDHHQAEDVAQECLIRLHSAVTRDDRDLRVRGWLSVVARHLCVDHLRRRTPRPVEEVPDTAVADEDPFDVDPALAAAWDRLAPRHREVLTHRELVGLSYDEIAVAMSTSVPAVETLLFRARASLRTHYKRAGGRLLGCGAYLFGLDRLARGPHAEHTVVAHVAACPACRRAVGQLDAVGQVLRGVVPPPVPSRGGVVAHQLTRLAEHISSALSPASSFGGQVGTALTAAVVALAPVAVPVAGRPSPPPARQVVTAVVPSPVAVTGPLPTAGSTPVGVTAVVVGSATPAPWPTPRPRWTPQPAPSWAFPLVAFPTASPTPWRPWPRPSQSWPAPW